MDKTAFWKIIDASRQASEGDPEAQLEVLEEQLSTLDADQIVSFDRMLTEYHNRAYTWGLWAAAFIIGGGCSDDGFMDFRGWLISRGEKTYETALRDPESLASVVTDEDGDCQIEGFQYAAPQAWEEKTGKEMDEFPDHDLPVNDEPTGEPWEEEDVYSQYPKLAKKFG